MPDESRILALLEEALDSKRTPEDVCADEPELLWEVRERFERCQNVEAQIEAMFPTTGSEKQAKRCLHLPTTLPVIPGYQIEAVLGRGGMGVVYKARHLKLNRSVAIKMLLCPELSHSDELTCLLREAQAGAGLTHANIVQVHDVGDLDGLPYFTMEFIEGGSLAQKLAGAPQPARDAASMMVLLARAVHAAHQGGVVHRDLKPSNILLAADGTPKITDFGLARQINGSSTVAFKGARVGTPSYMSPEQAMGKVAAFCPSVDVYALGAILYEMLTGRPPFKAETPSETRRQLISEEPVPPQRLNAKVPCDLQTICLKCLRKDPQRRYESAAELAEDIGRYLDGRPILARPPSLAGRAWRWARREPAAAALAATALALGVLAVGGGFWVQRQRAQTRTATARQELAVEAALAHAKELTELGHWPEARRALQGANGLLGASAPVGLRERLRQARADADIVVRLEEVRLSLSEGTRARGRTSPTADLLYAEAFASYGITLTSTVPTDAAAVVRGSPVRDILLVFLHDWLYWAPEDNRNRILAVVDLADDDPWRRAFRDARSKNDMRMLEELARAPQAAAQPPALLSGLGGALLADGQPEEARALLRAAQQRHPDDFWINFLLGHSLEQERPQEAVGYFRAAVAVRPGSDQANAALSATMHYLDDSDAAIVALQRAVAANPSRAGIAALIKVLAPKGRLEEARVIWEKMLASNPPDHDQWYGYAQLCLMLGKNEEYCRTREAILRRFGESDDWIIAERTSLACLLLPASPDELRPATALANRAMFNASKSSEPENAYVQFARGLSEYRQGRLDDAIPLLRDSAQKIPSRPGARLVLAMAQFRAGSPREARKTLAAAIAIYDWKQLPDDFPSVWTSHLLRREAEAMILPNLSAFLEGKHQPQDTDERLALLAICQVRGLYAVCAQLYSDAFAADPSLAEASTAECLRRAAIEKERFDRINVLKTEPRYLAARCAALAACGLGEDGPRLSAAERSKWRSQARAWLQADLAAWGKTLESDSEGSRDLAKEMLTLWHAEQDLAEVRDADQLKKLPAVEQEEWAALWSQVTVVLARAQAIK